MTTGKACAICPADRIQLGKGYHNVGAFRRMVGVLLIYLPVILFPVVILVVLMSSLSLRTLGARNLKRYRDFLPARSSHRYSFKNQIVMEPTPLLPHLGWKTFWQFNCSWYCPYSVALFEYQTYLVKAVENWWCPFYHSRKPQYNNAPLDQSYWHAKEGEATKLHKDDHDCSCWNDEAVVRIQGRSQGTASCRTSSTEASPTKD